MVQIIPQDDPTIAAGQSFGKGLSEQIPQEVDRYRLSKQLQQLGQSQGMTPFQQAAALHSAGASPETINTMLPYLRNQQAINELQAKAKTTPQAQPTGQQPQVETGQAAGETAQPGSPVSTVPDAEKSPEWLAPYAVDLRSIESPESVQAALKSIYVPTESEIEKRAAQLQMESPMRFDTTDKAIAQARREYESFADRQRASIEQQGRQVAIRDRFDQGFDAEIKKITQKGEDLDSLIPAEIQNKFRDRGRARIAAGDSPEKVIREESEKFNNLYKAQNSLKNNIGKRPMFGDTTKKLVNKINTLRPVYEKSGALELMAADLKDNLELSTHEAMMISYQPNKGLIKQVGNLSQDLTPYEVAVRVADNLKKDDSIFTLGRMLESKGINDAEVVDQLRELLDQEQINLNERQRREIAEYFPSKMSLGDLYMSTQPFYINMVSDWIQRPQRTYFERLKQAAGG